MAEANPNYSTPSAVRSVTSYPARRGDMAAFDCTAGEIHTMSTAKPAFIVGLKLTTALRASAA